jgi:hypothetical protein
VSRNSVVSADLHVYQYWRLVPCGRPAAKNIIGEQIDDLNGLIYKQPTAAILMLIFAVAGRNASNGGIHWVEYYLCRID